MPVAPPNDTFTSPPRARTASIWFLNWPLRGSNALNQLPLQPALLTNASENDLMPLLAAICARVGAPAFDSRPMSTYGATRTPLPPPPPEGGGGGFVVTGGLAGGGGGLGAEVVFVGPGAGFEDAAGGTGAAPPVHDAPLTVQDVGAPVPAAVKPNEADAPGAIVAL